jgi:hypothetical protein
MAVPAAVRTVTVSAAVVPAFMEKVLAPFGANTLIDAGASGSEVDVAEEPHAAQIARPRTRMSRRMRIRCARGEVGAREPA